MVESWRQSLEPFLGEIEAGGERARVVVVDNACEPPLDDTLAGRNGEIVRLDQRLSIGAARNAGLLRLDTDVVSFVDVDDRVDSVAMVSLYEDLKRAPPDVVGVFGRFDRLDRHGGRYLGRWPHRWALRMVGHPRLFAAVCSLINELAIGQAPMLRSSAVVRAGGFADLGYGEDWVLGARLAHVGRVRVLADAKPITYTSGVLSRRVGFREVFEAYENVRRTLLATPEMPLTTRLALRVLGAPLNLLRGAAEARRAP